jgi:hypothetical protein
MSSLHLHGSAASLWKTPKHSAPEAFDFHFKGETQLCWFVITDNRLITVTAAGHKRTVELGHTPPMALAETVAAEMFHAAEQAAVPAKSSQYR